MLKVNDGAAKFSPVETELIYSISERLAGAYRNAPDDIREKGAGWYTGKGAALAREVAAECGIPFETAAAIIAVCSTRTRWASQVQHTVDMVRHFQSGGDPRTAPPASLFVANRARAAEILAGADPAELLGPKTGPFFRNICGDWTVVTIDVWAVRAALGDKNMSEEEVDRWTKGRRRAIIEASYHLAAEKCGTDAASIQAITWVIIRGKAD